MFVPDALKASSSSTFVDCNSALHRLIGGIYLTPPTPTYGVRHEPEERRQRVGITACAGPGQLQNRLGAALRVTAPRESRGGGTKTIVRSDDRRELTLPGFLMFSPILGSPLGINRPLGRGI